MSVIVKAEANCRNCYRCVRVCPVKGVKVVQGVTDVVPDRCITCGECILACPQGANLPIDGVTRAKELIASGRRVVASIAPSYAAVFGPGSWQRLLDVLKALGFKGVYQTSEGAMAVSLALEDMARDLKDAGRPLLTSACPVVVELVRKYHPKACEYLSPLVSPMTAHVNMLREELGDGTEVVFIGPCAGKKLEGEGVASSVMGFDELLVWMSESGLSVRYRGMGSGTQDDDGNLPDDSIDARFKYAKQFPLPGYMARTAGMRPWADGILVVDGIDEVREVLRELEGGRMGSVVIEALACRGGCSNGPLIRGLGTGYGRKQSVRELTANGPEIDRMIRIIETYKDLPLTCKFETEPVETEMPSEEAIRRVLEATGKGDKALELNCGACGYRSCREKAIAVCLGMAELTMCMPYMEAKAQSMSNLVIDSTPNAIIVTDTDMVIQEFNTSAEAMFMRSRESVIGKPLTTIIPDDNFRTVAQGGNALSLKKVRYPKYGLTTHQTISLVPEHGFVLGLFTDTTREERREEELLKVKEQTLEKAQEVIDRQMRTVQEIAGLLGETAAESKLLLTSLMKLVAKEEGNKG